MSKNTEVTNLERARWAEIALYAFVEETNEGGDLRENPEVVVSDLLRDLQHYCVVRGFLFEALLNRASAHFDMETYEEGRP